MQQGPKNLFDGATPLEWAVQIRNFSLTKGLLEQRCKGLRARSCYQLSILRDSRFFACTRQPCQPKARYCKKNLCHIKRPFGYWLAYSKERINCTSSMLQLFEKYYYSMKVPHMSEPIDGFEISMPGRNGHEWDGDLQDQQESFRAIRFRSHSPTGFTRRAQSSSLFGFIPLSVFVLLIPDPL